MTSEAQIQNPDAQIIGQRADFTAKLKPHVGQIISEDAMYSPALSELVDTQREVFFGLIVENAALYQFGRLSTEAIKIKKTIWGNESIDPVKKRWDAQLRKAGVKDKDERAGYLEMLPSMSESVTIAYHMDPFIEK